MVAAASARVVNRAGAGGFRGTAGQVGYYTAAGVGPPGTATMTFFAAFRVGSQALFGGAQAGLFGRESLAAGGSGWILFYDGAGSWRVAVVDGAGANAIQTVFTGAGDLIDRSVVFIGNLAGGQLRGWSNIAGASAPLAAVGYTPSAAGIRTAIGNDSSLARPAFGVDIFDCGMLQGYDANASYNSPIYGAGLSGLGAQIIDDIEQGRDVQWPRAAVVNSDFYWTANDVAGSSIAEPSWVDRYSAIVVPRVGNVSGTSAPPRF